MPSRLLPLWSNLYNPTDSCLDIQKLSNLNCIIFKKDIQNRVLQHNIILKLLSLFHLYF